MKIFYYTGVFFIFKSWFVFIQRHGISTFLDTCPIPRTNSIEGLYFLVNKMYIEKKMSTAINHVHKVQPNKKIRPPCKKTRQTRPAFGQARKRIRNQRQRTRMKGHVISLHAKILFRHDVLRLRPTS